jgi:glycosyltransferase involved in cell wall biosynthesis
VRELVLVSYHFPPHGGKAVQRASKLAKYLPRFGWRPVVFALPRRQKRVPMDPSLCSEIPDIVEVRRPRLSGWRERLPGEVRKLLPRPLPDRYGSWARRLAPRVASLVRERSPAALLTTSPTHSAQLAGLLVRRATGIPWVADFRDPWSGHPGFGGRPGDDEMLELETEVLAGADAVVGVYPKILRDFRGRVEPDRLHLIENGYDEDDFSLVDWSAPPQGSGPLTLGHNGTVSAFHDPVPLLEAMRRLRASGRAGPGDLRAVFTTSDAGRKRFDGYGDLADCGMLEVRGYRPHAESIADLARLDVSLLLLTRGSGIYPGKVFEYMRLGNPILSVSRPGDDLHRLLEETGAGTTVDRESPDRIAEALVELLGRKRSGELTHLDPDLPRVRRYSREAIAGRYAEVLDGIAKGGRREG